MVWVSMIMVMVVICSVLAGAGLDQIILLCTNFNRQHSIQGGNGSVHLRFRLALVVNKVIGQVLRRQQIGMGHFDNSTNQYQFGIDWCQVREDHNVMYQYRSVASRYNSNGSVKLHTRLVLIVNKVVWWVLGL